MEAYIKKIVYSSMLCEQEKEWMKEYVSQSVTVPTYNNEGRYVERIITPNFFNVAGAKIIICDVRRSVVKKKVKRRRTSLLGCIIGELMSLE